jgi:hypothetical protein
VLAVALLAVNRKDEEHDGKAGSQGDDQSHWSAGLLSTAPNLRVAHFGEARNWLGFRE